MSHLLFFLSSHGFLIVFLAVALMLLVLAIGRKKYPAGSKLALLLPVFAVINLIWGGSWNARYVYKNGVRGEAVVTKIVPTNSYINEVQVMEYHCLLRTKSGKVVPVLFENNGDIFYPTTDLWMPPAIGETFTVRYISGHEENFIIPTDDPKSHYADKLRCTKLIEQIATAKAAYLFDEKNSGEKNTYKNLLKQFIQLDCDTNLTKVYQMELDNLLQK